MRTVPNFQTGSKLLAGVWPLFAVLALGFILGSVGASEASTNTAAAAAASTPAVALPSAFPGAASKAESVKPEAAAESAKPETLKSETEGVKAMKAAAALPPPTKNSSSTDKGMAALKHESELLEENKSEKEKMTKEASEKASNKEGEKSESAVATEGAAAEPPAEPASDLGELPLPTAIKMTNAASIEDRLKAVQEQFELARSQRRDKDYTSASQVLVGIMKLNIPVEYKRKALFELALIAQDEGKLIKAQQIFSQYLNLYGKDPSAPEILLRQGLIYRQMGVNTLAISKFYAVMSSALKLKLENMEYYQKLVLQAQVEIADTFYMDGNYEDACDYYNRLLKNGSQDLDREQIHFKLVRSLSFHTNSADMVARAQSFLGVYTNSTDVPEVRFLLASVLKRIGRNQDAMKQVLQLLHDQQGVARKNPDVWTYWQQRAGNEIAAQLYKEGEFLSALQIYANLATLDKSPEWQLPVWYQIALVYEQLQQPVKAMEYYGNIMDRKKDLKPGAIAPSLESLLEMSRWRKDYLTWLEKAKSTNASLKPNLYTTNESESATAPIAPAAPNPTAASTATP